MIQRGGHLIIPRQEGTRMSRSGTAVHIAEIRLTARVAGRSAARGCAACGKPLEMHQPDTADPERLLGTCPACGAWSVIQPGSAEETVHVLQLPRPTELDKAFG